MSVLDRAGPPPDEVVAYGDDPDQVIEHWYADGPPVVLLHGGFWRPVWDRTHLRTLAGAFRDAGHRVALPEYRRVPGAPDRTVADVMAALDAVGPGIVVGHSAGGHLALHAAVEPGVLRRMRAVVALAPVADLVLAEDLDLDGGAVRDFLGGAACSRPDLDPNRSAGPGVPVTVLHGTDDDRVPIAVSRSYAETHDIRLVTLPGADHFALIDPESAVWPVLLEEVTRR